MGYRSLKYYVVIGWVGVTMVQCWWSLENKDWSALLFGKKIFVISHQEFIAFSLITDSRRCIVGNRWQRKCIQNNKLLCSPVITDGSYRRPSATYQYQASCSFASVAPQGITFALIFKKFLPQIVLSTAKYTRGKTKDETLASLFIARVKTLKQ